MKRPHGAIISVSQKSTLAPEHPLRASARANGLRIENVTQVQLYASDKILPTRVLEKLVQIVTNPVTEVGASLSASVPQSAQWGFVIGFLPGVTDNVGKTVASLAHDAGYSAPISFSSSTLYCIEGECTEADVHSLAEPLFNPLIQYCKVFDRDSLRSFLPFYSAVTLHAHAHADIVALRNAPDDVLTSLGKQGIQNSDGTTRGPLALSLHDMKTIQAYFKKEKRDPTDVELESIAQTWSEHCKHTIFSDPLDELKDGIYRTYIKGATQYIRKKKGKKDLCVSVFSDNAGAIAFDKNYLVTHKVETHNSPSALDPFGGAITGIVGVNRDTLGFGLGAKPIANVYGFCVGHPHDMTMYYRGKNQSSPLLSSERILRGVVAGVGSGGNESGIPTPVGFVVTDSCYRGKPLVFAGTVGLIPRKVRGRASHKKSARSGDLIVVAGGRVGLDGIHGATFSSEALESGSPATAVQIGDPITQKKLTDAMLNELRDAGLYNSVTDNGAGGISCSVAEMAKECGGAVVDLQKVPTKYPGLSPWQVWISESQERMTFAVPRRKWKMFAKIFKKYEVECAAIGTFTKAKRCVVTVGKKTVMNLSMDFLHNGRVPRQQTTQKPLLPEAETLKGLHDAPIAKTLTTILSHVAVGSIAPITMRYDHEVQATSVTKPLQGKGRVRSEAAVIAPVRGSSKGIALSSAIRFSRTPHDAYSFSALAIDEAIRAALAAGATLESIAILDNYCWSSSGKPERLWELKESTRACFDTATAYLTPFISGKDSMFNDFRGYTEVGEAVHIAAPPTLLISAIGHVPDIRTAQTLDFKAEGDHIVLLGETRDELGGSEYTVALGAVAEHRYAHCAPVTVDTKKNKKVYAVLESLIQKGYVNATYALQKGGLAAGLSKMAIAGKRGADVQLTSSLNPRAELFSESAGRFLVTIPDSVFSKVQILLSRVPHVELGTVGGNSLQIDTTEGLITVPVETLAHHYHNTPTV